jgi:Fic family protein
MNRNELAALLKREYEPGRGFGVEHVDDPTLKNIWFVVPPPPPQKLPRGLPAQALAKASRLIAELGRGQQANELEKNISYLFVRREAVQSSRMEGTWSTIDHVLTPGELFDRKEGKSERASVLGYATALEKEYEAATRTGHAVFSESGIRRLHRKIMSKDPHFRGNAGELRAPGRPGAVVFIGGLRRKEDSIYNPTPPRHVARCLDEVLSWMGNSEIIELGAAGMGMSLPIRMAIGHSHFEAVHPFPDGNGRVGRMLMALQMVREGRLPLYLSGFIEIEKKQYVEALQAAQKKLRYAPIVEFICEAIVAAKHESDQTKQAILDLPQAWESRAVFRASSELTA